MPGEDFLYKWLPLILTGGSMAGQVVGSKIAAGSTDRAAELQAESAQKQLDALIGMYGINRNDLAPYRAVGTNALANLQNWRPNDPNRKFSTVDLSKFKPDQVSLPSGLSRLTSGGNAFAAPGTSGGGGAPTFSDIPTSGIQSRWGRVANNAFGGYGLGQIGKSVGGAFLSPAMSAAFLGPAAIAAPVIGAVKGLFDNNNPDKNFATEGINRVSDWTWNKLMPAVRNGQISPDEAEQQFNNIWGQWEASMRNVPNFNQGVYERSVASQKQYFQPFFDQINQLRQQQPVATA